MMMKMKMDKNKKIGDAARRRLEKLALKDPKTSEDGVTNGGLDPAEAVNRSKKV